jgi:hypothetical protein
MKLEVATRCYMFFSCLFLSNALNFLSIVDFRGYARGPPPHTNPQGHRRLSSIDNDEWSEGGEEEEELERSSEARRRSRQRRLRTKELPGRSQQQRSHDRPRRVQSSR